MEKNIKLQVIELTKNFELKEKKRMKEIRGAVSGVSFDVYDGEFLSILGPSGCGKTTILRMLIGLLEPTSGTIYKDGENITHLHPSQRKMGIVFQNYALFENMTVLENVEYALKINKETRDTAREVATDLIEKMGLSEHINKKPSNLSGGQQQRVAIARTLALHPEIILFDEPMSALDVATRLTLRAELKKIQKEFKTTMIYITHDQEEAFALSDRIMVMEMAKISQIGTPEELVKNPANDYVKEFVVGNLMTKINSLKHFAEIVE